MQDWTNEYYFAHKDEYLEKLKETGMQVNEDVDRDDIKNAMMPAIEEFLKSQPGDFVDHLSGNLRSVQQLNRPFKKVHFHLTVLQ